MSTRRRLVPRRLGSGSSVLSLCLDPDAESVVSMATTVLSGLGRRMRKTNTRSLMSGLLKADANCLIGTVAMWLLLLLDARTVLSMLDDLESVVFDVVVVRSGSSRRKKP